MSTASKLILDAITNGESQPRMTYCGSFRDLHFQVRNYVKNEFREAGVGPDAADSSGVTCVYFIRFTTESHSVVKIGYATDITKRFKHFTKDLPPFPGTQVRLLGTLHFGGWWYCRKAETLFIEGLREYHVKGEWFDLPDQICREIIDTCRIAAPIVPPEFGRYDRKSIHAWIRENSRK